MCFGSNSKASDAAAAQQANQQQSINQNVTAINGAFANRSQQYSDYLSALRGSYQSQLQMQGANAGRQLKFSLARGGLTGSSVAADQGGELQREEANGQITAEGQAQGKLAGLESADTAEKQQLIQLASTGANIGNAAQQTATALSANLQNAQSNLSPDTLGNIFGGVQNSYNAMNTAYNQRLGLRAAQAYTGAFSNSSNTDAGFGGNK